jgi:glycosyltransferase involved in cell wall biosynthesis
MVEVGKMNVVGYTDYACGVTPWMPNDGVPKLASVVMPTRNRPELTLKAAISVFNQSYRPLELIVVDDGSTDDTVTVLEKWRDEVSQTGNFEVRIIVQKPAGAPTARNRGCVESRGEFIQFMDSDDLMHPEKLRIQAQVLGEIPSCDFAFCNFATFTDDASITFSEPRKKKPADIMPAMFLQNVPGTVWQCLYRRSLISRSGPWNETLKKWQDLDYMARLCCESKPRAAHIHVVLYYVRMHSAARIRDLYQSASGVECSLQSLSSICRTLDKCGAWNSKVAKEIAQFYVGAAVQAMKYGPTEKVSEALNLARELDVSASFRRNLLCLSAVYHTLGGSLCAALFPWQARVSKFVHCGWRRRQATQSPFEENLV